MARPRKRKRRNSIGGLDGRPPTKKGRARPQSGRQQTPIQAQHSILNQFYPQVLTLRNYVLSRLPATSRLRRKKIAVVGIASESPGLPVSSEEQSLGALLDNTLIGIPKEAQNFVDDNIEGWKSFSQKGEESDVTLSDGIAGFVETQAFLLEYVVTTLFSRAKAGTWPKHLLCDGYRRNRGLGLRMVQLNPHVEMLKGPPWPHVLALMGDSGERIMIDLLLNCSIFVPIKAGTNNFCQISGRPLSDVEALSQGKPGERRIDDAIRSPSEIVFIRNRMLYARAAFNARGHPDEGDEKSAESNRQTVRNEVHTLRVLMYIFPRQFGLHNAFTSKVNFKETSQRLKDYTLREEEILEKFGRLNDPNTRVHTPKRLRGGATELVRKLQILHQRCSYSKLLQHHCPLHSSLDYRQVESIGASSSHKVSRKVNVPRKTIASQLQEPSSSSPGKPIASVFDLATPVARISAFCQAVLKKIVPNGFWGSGSAAEHNENEFLKMVHRFINMRRFEVMSIHDVIQGMKVTEVDWLAPPWLRSSRTSQTDLCKRRELFNEFLYFLFDSLLIPLIRSNFYVTESNTHKCRLFFFRHDVWRYVAEPAMSSLKTKMFSEVDLARARQILDSRALGFSQVRLLPKQIGMRPIMNLRRRIAVQGKPKELLPGINRILAPAHTILQLEKAQRLGSAMFHVGDVYKRIKLFKSRISKSGMKLYFAKLDVQSAFDTIPQAAIVGLLNSIPQQRRYRVTTYFKVTSNSIKQAGNLSKAKPLKKWPSVATSSHDSSTLLQLLETDQASAKSNTVFVDRWKKYYETSEVLQLVAAHIQQNLVKIGKKFYRQRQGIPQGSVLSSTLCNYFYADLEAHVLSFLQSEDCLLLRLIDDFLLITTNKPKAVRFVETMHQGVPEYGVTVNTRKTLVNFDLNVNGEPVTKLGPGRGFPYCGTTIDCETLDVSRNREKEPDTGIYNSLTVEFSRAPGRTFERKVLNAFKIQSHLMFFDSELNSSKTTLSNIYNAFSETATKMWAYARCLPPQKQPPGTLVIRAVSKVIDMAFLLLKSKTRKLRYPGYTCDVKKLEVSWLAYNAFYKVLERKQSKYGETLGWLKAQIMKLSLQKDICQGRVLQVACGQF
ncbi:Telomerase reverse transcriptase [Parahypoxylon ruwenzoriense]